MFGVEWKQRERYFFFLPAFLAFLAAFFLAMENSYGTGARNARKIFRRDARARQRS